MAEDSRQTLSRLTQATIDALIEASRAGDGLAGLDPDLTRQVFVACLASFIEADPRVKTRKDMRAAADRVAGELRLQVETLRRHFIATGEYAGWDATGGGAR